MQLLTPLPSLYHSKFKPNIYWFNSLPLVDGKKVLVHFWSISCFVCKPDLLIIRDWIGIFPDLQLFGIHIPLQQADIDSPEAKEVALEGSRFYPQCIDNTFYFNDVFGNEYVPSYYFFDNNHLLRYATSGENGLSLLSSFLADFDK